MLAKITGSRTRFLAFVVILLMVVFVGRLFYIQIIKHGYYLAQADSEYIKQFVLRAKRGEIYVLDNGQPVSLVMNQTVYTVWADPVAVSDKQKVIDTLNRVAGGNTRPGFEKYLETKNSRYQILAFKLSRTQAEMIKKEKLAGIGFDAVSQRVYPEGELASQLLGFVDAEGRGRYGFEQYNDAELKGQDGLLKTVTDVRDVPLTVGNKNVKTPAKDGRDIVLTIDRSVQAKTEQALAATVGSDKNKRASAIIMDPSTGRVLAMANMPTYNPGKLNEVGEKVELFNNYVTNSPYEVGSVAKTFTVAMGLNEGVITPESTYNNTGSIRVDDKTIGNASVGRKLGNITMQDALDWSLNTGMVTIAQRLGDGTNITYGSRQTMYDYLHNKLRLKQPTGIELAGEAAGLIISPDDPSGQGNAVRYSNMAFGQGMDITMVQTAAAFCSIINGGSYYKPTVVAGYMNGDIFQKINTKPISQGVISAAASAQVREMVHQAHYATYRPDGGEGYYVGGKTGTSQTIDTKTGNYSNDETIATYLGFGGNDRQKPSYVIMTTVYGKGTYEGGLDAKPIFNELSDWMIDHLKLEPKG